MKKVIATSLAFAVLLGLSACGGRSDDTPIEKPSSVSARTTEPTTSDVVEYDPLENVEIDISDSSNYPKALLIHHKFNFEDYRENNFVNAKVISAATDKIVIELSVDENAVADYFGETPYNLKKSTKELIFDTKEICSYPLYADYITNDVVCGIETEARERVSKAISGEYDDELSLESVYVGTVARDDTYITDLQFIENGNETADYGLGIEIYKSLYNLPYRLWFVYKNKDEKIFTIDTCECVTKNGELFNYRFLPYSLTDKGRKVYDSIEEAKKDIEEICTGFEWCDNVQLEELPIPDSLK